MLKKHFQKNFVKGKKAIFFGHYYKKYEPKTVEIMGHSKAKQRLHFKYLDSDKIDSIDMEYDYSVNDSYSGYIKASTDKNFKILEEIQLLKKQIEESEDKIEKLILDMDKFYI